jgi:GntR family transcriptional repressor for pyruvate dehydrogenase complex
LKLNISPPKISASSMSETVAQYIIDAICSGQISESDQFPSQYELAEKFSVSRTVIREATQILVSKGMLEVHHGKRIVIRPPSYDQISESVSLAFKRSNISIFDVLELRKVLEVEVVAHAALRRSTDNIIKLKQLLQFMEEHINEEIGYVDADVEFHRAIFDAANQPAFNLVINSIHDYLTDSRKSSYRGLENTRRALRAHESILQAIERQDSQGAREAMLRHLEETEEDLRQSEQFDRSQKETDREQTNS